MNCSTKQLGPALKSLLSICVLVILYFWPFIGIASSVVGGLAYGFLSPVFATFQAVGGKKTNAFYHSIYVCIDGSYFLHCLYLISHFAFEFVNWFTVMVGWDLGRGERKLYHC